MAIRGLTFIVREKHSVSTYFGLFFFFFLVFRRHDSHATYHKQSSLTNKPHFGIDLGVDSPMLCTIGAM